MPLDSRTRATFRSAEFGFFGVIVFTTVQTPRFCGHPCMAGCLGLDRCGWRGDLISWLIVGIRRSCSTVGGAETGISMLAGQSRAGSPLSEKEWESGSAGEGERENQRGVLLSPSPALPLSHSALTAGRFRC